MNTTGSETVSRIEKEFDSHALHHSFIVSGAAVKVGQPLKLATNGTVVALTAGDTLDKVVGHSVHDGAIGDRVTLAMRARAITHSLSDAALNPGPVKFNAIDTVSGKTKYVTTAVAAEVHGYSLTVAGAANIKILVAVL